MYHQDYAKGPLLNCSLYDLDSGLVYALGKYFWYFFQVGEEILTNFGRKVSACPIRSVCLGVLLSHALLGAGSPNHSQQLTLLLSSNTFFFFFPNFSCK